MCPVFVVFVVLDRSSCHSAAAAVITVWVAEVADGDRARAAGERDPPGHPLLVQSEEELAQIYPRDRPRGRRRGPRSLEQLVVLQGGAEEERGRAQKGGGVVVAHADAVAGDGDGDGSGGCGCWGRDYYPVAHVVVVVVVAFLSPPRQPVLMMTPPPPALAFFMAIQHQCHGWGGGGRRFSKHEGDV